MAELDRLQSAVAGRYVLGRELGHGAFATVYAARDLAHERDVAVKVLHQDLAGLLGRSRFLREIEIASSLHHPGIVPLLDSGVSDDATWYVMPVVDGETLRDRLDRERQLPLDAVVGIARDVGAALTHAHSLDIVHRDIKPANILLSGGQAFVADFGIARALSAAAGDRLTTSGIAVGTPEYMSPEQAGAVDPVDGRSDVYALGCVVYEALAGDPPFTGGTVQAVLARQQYERPRSLAVVRPETGIGVERAVEKALAKSPADRWPTVAEFVAALATAAASPESAEYPMPGWRGTWQRVRGRAWLVGATVGAVVVAAAAALVTLLGAPQLDPHRVVVFPLQARGDTTLRDAGVALGSLINVALETAEPLKVVDGWNWITLDQRRDPTLITPADLARIAKRQRARYALQGWLTRVGDSTRVAVSLLDVQGDSVLPQVSQAGLAGPTFVAELGMRAVVGLLSRFLAPGRRIDLAALQDRDLAAVVATVLGDLDYREARFSAAMTHYQRALNLDSAMVLAALKGAQAASWQHDVDSGRTLVALALRHLGHLPPKYRHFALGLQAYLRDDADSAAAALGQAIALDPGWAEAQMALGEVHYHYVYGGYAPDSLAEARFEAARRIDPGFTPALYHLFQIAVRRGWDARADSLFRALRAAGPERSWMAQVTWVGRCRRDGPDAVNWVRAAHGPGDASWDITMVGHTLAGAGADLPCAERAFRTALREAPPDSLFTRWDALVGLQTVLVAEGKSREVRRLLDWAVDSVHPTTRLLQLVDAAEGVGTDSGALAWITANGGERADLRRTEPSRIWRHGLWAWHRRDPARLAQLLAVLGDLQRTGSRDGTDTLVSGGLEAKLSLVRGDTARAIHLLRALQPRGTMGAISWQFMGTLPEERLLLAKLLLATGDYAGALDVAGVFDSSQPMAYVMYLPASLQVRRRAAEALGRTAQAARYRDRLLALGRRDLL